MAAEADALDRLWQRLAPRTWPLPLSALPAGSALVGGAVRDALLGRLGSRPDLDLVVPCGAIELCRTLARQLGGSAVVLDQQRDIGRVVLRGWCLDLAAREGCTLADDLQRRDYSINALALPLPPGAALLDPTDGIAALGRRQLVAISEANLLSDPLRLLRGLRLAAELNFDLAPPTRAWIWQHSGSLSTIAGERVLSELEKLACAPDGAAGLLQVLQAGLLQPWQQQPPAGALPAALAHLTPERATAKGLSTAEQAWALPLARLTCLADADTLARLRSSRALQKRVQQLRQQWHQLAGRDLDQLDEPSRFALHCQLEEDLPALLLLQPTGVAPLLERWRDRGDPLLHPRSPLDGTALQQQLGIAAGPRLGGLLLHLSRERAFGRLPRELSSDADSRAVRSCAQLWLQRQDGPAA